MGTNVLKTASAMTNNKPTIHLVSGFLGSGKTTAIRQACGILKKQQRKAAVITNDQGIKIVDTFLFNGLGVPGRQVAEGCFCCNYNELDSNIDSLIGEHDPEVIFAEAVGSCTDIVATVLKPLRKFRESATVTFSTIVDSRLLYLIYQGSAKIFDDDVAYIFFKQLEEAAILVLNKTDVMTAAEMGSLIQYVEGRFPGKKIIMQNSTSEDGVAEWVEELEHASHATPASLSINYDRYAAGEAMMGYLDKEILVRSKEGKAVEASVALMREFAGLVNTASLGIGHLKCWVNDRYKFSLTSTNTDFDQDVEFESSERCSLIVNARVQAHPSLLEEMMEAAAAKTMSLYRCLIAERSSSAFQPGYPRPVHRFTD